VCGPGDGERPICPTACAFSSHTPVHRNSPLVLPRLSSRVPFTSRGLLMRSRNARKHNDVKPHFLPPYPLPLFASSSTVRAGRMASSVFCPVECQYIAPDSCHLWNFATPRHPNVAFQLFSPPFLSKTRRVHNVPPFAPYCHKGVLAPYPCAPDSHTRSFCPNDFYDGSGYSVFPYQRRPIFFTATTSYGQ